MNFKESILERRFETALVLCVFVYTVIFSHQSILKHTSFASYAWDLGTFNQIYYSSIYGGRFYYYTPELFLNPSGSYFAIHFSPILLLLFPIYAIFPSVQTLLISKSLILSLAAVPLFYLSKKMTGSEKTSLVVSCIYLLYPGLHGANWFDFQPQIFIPLFAFTTFLMLIEEKWPYYFASLFITLTIQEHVSVILITLLLSYLTYSNLREIVASIRQLSMDKNTVPLISILFSAIFFYVSNNFRQRFPITPEFVDVYKASSVFLALDFKGGTLSLPLYALSHLDKTINALNHDLTLKFLYGLFILAPILFLPLMSRFMIFNLILLSPFLLSNYRAYYMIGSHYPLYILSPIFISMVYTLKTRTQQEGYTIAKYSLIASSLMILVLSPISPASVTMNRGNDLLWYPPQPRITGRVRETHRIIDSIPGDAAILTQNHLFPHVSDRVDAYVLPVPQFSPEQRAYLENYIDTLIERCDYILLDLKVIDDWTLYAHRKLASSPDFGVQAFSEMVILFQRGLAGPLTIADLEKATYHAHEDMHIGFGEIVSDSTAASGLSAASPRGSGEGFFLYGPYTYLMGRAYDVSFCMKALNQGEGYLGTFEVTSDRGAHILTKRDIYGYEFPDAEWRNFTVKLTLDEPKELVEFRFFTVGAGDVFIDTIECVKDNGTRGYPCSTRTFNYRSLYTLNNSRVIGDVILHNASSGGDVFWYGPYHSLTDGRYTATYYLKAVGDENATARRAITLDVASEEGKHVLASRDVTFGDLEENEIGGGWSAVRLSFEVRAPETVVEFRGLTPSGDCALYLSQIILDPE